jgi:hypothetical protein
LQGVPEELVPKAAGDADIADDMVIWGEHQLLRDRRALIPALPAIKHGAEVCRLSAQHKAELHVMYVELLPDTYGALWHEFATTIPARLADLAGNGFPNALTPAGNLQPGALDWLRREAWEDWAHDTHPAIAHAAAYWGDSVVEVDHQLWGGMKLARGSWAMLDPALGLPFQEQQQPVDAAKLPGVMRTPTELWFLRVVRPLAVPHPMHDPRGGGEWHAVLEVQWFKSPGSGAGGAYAAELQAPLISDAQVQCGSSRRTPRGAYIPPSYLLPLEFVVEPFEPQGTLVALRRTWQPLSAVGAQPPWPELMHYNVSHNAGAAGR